MVDWRKCFTNWFHDDFGVLFLFSSKKKKKIIQRTLNSVGYFFCRGVSMCAKLDFELFMVLIGFLLLCVLIFAPNVHLESKRCIHWIYWFLHCSASLTVSVYDLVDSNTARTITINKENYGGYRWISVLNLQFKRFCNEKKKLFSLKNWVKFLFCSPSFWNSIIHKTGVFVTKVGIRTKNGFTYSRCHKKWNRFSIENGDKQQPNELKSKCNGFERWWKFSCSRFFFSRRVLYD